MTNPYRAMCAELLAALEIQLDELRFNNRLCIHARELLDQPVAEGPTDEEIMELMPQEMRDDLAAAARAMTGFDSPRGAITACRIILNRHAVDHARAVLSRYSHQ